MIQGRFQVQRRQLESERAPAELPVVERWNPRALTGLPRVAALPECTLVCVPRPPLFSKLGKYSMLFYNLSLVISHSQSSEVISLYFKIFVYLLSSKRVVTI